MVSGWPEASVVVCVEMLPAALATPARTSAVVSTKRAARVFTHRSYAPRRWKSSAPRRPTRSTEAEAYLRSLELDAANRAVEELRDQLALTACRAADAEF